MRVSTDPAPRRRLIFLAGAAALALLIGVIVGAGAGDGDAEPTHPAVATAPSAQVEQAAKQLPLKVQVGQLLVSSFDGSTVPEYIRRRLRQGQTAGVIVFGRNTTLPAGFRAIGHAVQAASRHGALVAADQEGGEIRTLPFAQPVPSQPLQGTPAQIARRDKAAARQLLAAGVNVDLAPVADVGSGPNAALAGRFFAGDSAAVAARVKAAVSGYQQSGKLAAAAKHFPGLGAATTNTDQGSATIRLPAGQLESRALPPFRAAVDAGAKLVMLGHALYPTTDRHRIASQSHAIATGLLRDTLGFQGVAVTDSMEAQAVLAHSGVATAAERSVRAGADLLLLTGSGSWNLVYPRLLARARRDPAFRARVHESAARVLALKRSLGLRATPPKE